VICKTSTINIASVVVGKLQIKKLRKSRENEELGELTVRASLMAIGALAAAMTAWTEE